jgi:hypothetical protein
MGTINFTNRNLSILNPVQIGLDNYPENYYIFKSATTNLLSVIFDPNLFNTPNGDVINVTNPLDFLPQTFSFDGTKWVYGYDLITDANNYVIPENYIVTIQTQNITQVPVGGGAIIQRYYFRNTLKGIIKNKYLSQLPTSRSNYGPISGAYIYKEQKTLIDGIDVYPTGNNGRETYQIKYQGPVNTRLIDILDPFLLFTADPDAQSYFNRANITDRMAKINISEFCLGLKNLNVWDKLEKIWILKSGYNYDGRNGLGAEDYKNFYDLKNITFSGSGNGTIIKSLSGYKPLANIPSNDFLTFTNDSIIFTGNWTSMFLLQNYTGTPVNFEILFSNEGYQSSGFRMGYQDTKEFSLWSSQSVPVGTNFGFNLLETNIHNTPYSFITAGVKSNLMNSGMATVLVDNKNKIELTGYYYDSSRRITTLSAPAGGTYSFPNNIAFFALSYQDLSNYHSGIRDLAKNTIYNNLNF